VAYSVYTVLGKRWNATGVPALAVGTALGAIPFLLMAVFTEPLVPSMAAADLSSWLNLVALGVLPTGLSVIWFFSLVFQTWGGARVGHLVPCAGVRGDRIWRLAWRASYPCAPAWRRRVFGRSCARAASGSDLEGQFHERIVLAVLVSPGLCHLSQGWT